MRHFAITAKILDKRYSSGEYYFESLITGHTASDALVIFEIRHRTRFNASCETVDIIPITEREYKILSRYWDEGYFAPDRMISRKLWDLRHDNA